MGLGHPAMHTEGVDSRVSLGLVVGFSDMWHVTADAQHLTPDTQILNSDKKNALFLK